MKKWIGVILVLGAILVSCKKNPYVRDVAHISVEVQLLPFYTDILALANNYSEEHRMYMEQTYGSFFESYNVRIMKIGLSTDEGYAERLAKLLHEEWIQELYTKSNEVFAQTTQLQKELQELLQYYRYYFPEADVPKVCMFIGAVQYSIVLDSGMIAIGIDKYLGSDYRMYREMEMSTFIRRNLYPAKIPADFARAIAENDFPNPFQEDYLLAHMIQNGRYMYLVRSLLPYLHDTVVWGYSARQLEFCQKSEQEFWKYFVSTDNLLFGSDYMTMKRFIDDGPFTPVFTRESPAKIGQWVGFRIVESFMKNNPDVSIEQLFEMHSSQEIMRRAKYNP